MEHVDLYKIGEEVLVGARIESRKFDNNGNVVYGVTIKGSRGEFPLNFEHDMIFQKKEGIEKKVVKNEKI